MVLILQERIGKRFVIVAGFRPLAGIMVLIVGSKLMEHVFSDWFPSPCGDYGSYRRVWLFFGDYQAKFPSPCGDYGSYLNKHKYGAC